ncbi:hypothetical protein HPP92_011464 [Vanilla planifolia]|uniref:Uncharacterized protein n=1 Tax=Vanilla planifolia TaxID=51239 RepID=A0A835R0V6_VANPL|nr:hypothetical protein HPP92_011464 [Vanilla planifolia]
MITQQHDCDKKGSSPKSNAKEKALSLLALPASPTTPPLSSKPFSLSCPFLTLSSSSPFFLTPVKATRGKPASDNDERSLQSSQTEAFSSRILPPSTPAKPDGRMIATPDDGIARISVRVSARKVPTRGREQESGA